MMADVTIYQYGAVMAVALAAAIIGGISGYGTGLLLPPVLVPIVGAEAVIPIVSVSAILTNGSRLAALRREFKPGTAALIVAAALPTCLIGAYGYTMLSGAAASIVIGSALLLLVPFRRFVLTGRTRLSRGGIAAAGSGYGVLVGGTAGSGVVLLSILMAAGLGGSAVIATDAGISLAMGVAKAVVFQSVGALPQWAWVMALLIGLAAAPGAFIAKGITRYISLRSHTLILDMAVMIGGLLLVLQGIHLI